MKKDKSLILGPSLNEQDTITFIETYLKHNKNLLLQHIFSQKYINIFKVNLSIIQLYKQTFQYRKSRNSQDRIIQVN